MYIYKKKKEAKKHVFFPHQTSLKNTLFPVMLFDVVALGASFGPYPPTRTNVRV